MKDWKEHVDAVFATAREHTIRDCDKIAGELIGAGRLGSGLAVKLAVEAFETRTLEAIDTLGGEVANAIEHHGRAWRKAFDRVDSGFETHLRSASDTLATLTVTRVRNSPADRVDELLEEVGVRARRQAAFHRNGYRSPRPRAWHERRPISYALISGVIGLVFGQVVEHSGLIPKAWDGAYKALTRANRSADNASVAIPAKPKN